MAWRSLAYRASRPLLFRFEPERIHRLTIDALRIAGENSIGRWVAGLLGGVPAEIEPVEVAGMRFRNRIGVGAGFDKDGVALRGWAALGLGFAEVGTITPLPQEGNPRPRLFRLPADGALVNRLGFNNAGAAAVSRNVMLARRHLPDGFVVGINLGPNRATPEASVLDDYLAAERLAGPVADYLVVNVSSPNTPGLRAQQAPERLVRLVEALAAAGEERHNRPPLFIKLAPDLDDADREAIVGALLETPVAGLILSNSTLERGGLGSSAELAGQVGGLSGAPLLARTVAAVRQVRGIAGDRLAIIASGGIGSADDATAVRGAGADLLQLWTGLVYRGPGLIGEAAKAVR
jgi:dihydroorotate dehydrogenase